MNRRRFLAALVGVPFLPSALSALPANFGNRFIGTDVYIPVKKVMARIRITPEVLADYHDVTFPAFMRGRQWLGWDEASLTWETLVSHEERRRLIETTPPERRFVEADGTLRLGGYRGGVQWEEWPGEAGVRNLREFLVPGTSTPNYPATAQAGHPENKISRGDQRAAGGGAVGRGVRGTARNLGATVLVLWLVTH